MRKQKWLNYTVEHRYRVLRGLPVVVKSDATSKVDERYRASPLYRGWVHHQSSLFSVSPRKSPESSYCESYGIALSRLLSSVSFHQRQRLILTGTRLPGEVLQRHLATRVYIRKFSHIVDNVVNDNPYDQYQCLSYKENAMKLTYWRAIGTIRTCNLFRGDKWKLFQSYTAFLLFVMRVWIALMMEGSETMAFVVSIVSYFSMSNIVSELSMTTISFSGMFNM